jgi:hypothetical protein
MRLVPGVQNERSDAKLKTALNGVSQYMTYRKHTIYKFLTLRTPYRRLTFSFTRFHYSVRMLISFFGQWSDHAGSTSILQTANFQGLAGQQLEENCFHSNTKMYVEFNGWMKVDVTVSQPGLHIISLGVPQEIVVEINRNYDIRQKKTPNTS